VNFSEALFLATLVLICLAAHGKRWASWRRTAVAAGLSAGLGLAAAHLRWPDLGRRSRSSRRTHSA
jgi:hypothetical protein